MSTPIHETHKSVTTDAHGGPTNTPQSKVVASTVGAGIGAALTTITVYLIESLGGIALPEEVKGAAVTLISAGVAFLAGYIKRPTGVN